MTTNFAKMVLSENSTIKLKGSSILFEIEKTYSINKALQEFIQSKREKGSDLDVEVFMDESVK